MGWKKVKLKEVLTQIKDSILIDNSKDYKLVTVSNKGVIKLREIVKGLEISANKAFVAKKGQFIYSRLSIHNGAFGIIPSELNGALVTSEMPLFEFKDVINPNFFIYSLKNNSFKFQLEQLTKGVGRTRVKENSFLDLVIDLPSIEIQNLIVSKIKSFENKGENILNELTHQLDLIKQLRQAFLREAMQGCFEFPQQPLPEALEGNGIETGHDLLAKIKVEKAQLIAEKKLKKEKDLSPITEDEIPFEIPEHWAWCRLGEISSKIGSGSTPKGSNYAESGKPFFRSQNIYDNGLVFDDIKFISDEVQQQMNGTIVLANDILLNITGGSMGRCALVPNDFEEGNVSQHVCIIRPLLLNNLFLHKLVLSPYCKFQ